MKVWHLLSNRWNSAITEYALSSALALKNHSGWDTVFTPLAHSPAEQRARTSGFTTLSMSKFSLKQLREFNAIAQTIKPEIIIAYGGPEATLARFLPSALRCPVYRFRGIPVQKKFQRIPWLFSLAHQHVTGIFAPNQLITEQLVALNSSQAVTCIPLGMPEDIYKRMDSVARKPELLLVGRFDPVKGHREFLTIFAHYLRSSAHFVRPNLHIVGEAANISSKQIRSFISEAGLKIGRDVILSDFRVTNLPELMNAATLGVISSLGSEYICRVAEEFLLCGTPLLVSGAGATEEVLFTGAGLSYRGLPDNHAAQVLGKAFLSAWNESGEERRKRALTAHQRYSLAAMANNLQNWLEKKA